MRIAFLLILTFLINFYVFPQEEFIPPQLEFQQLSKGLSSNNIKCIFQDYLGYIWVGTHNGLNRFDGIDFEIFEHNIQDSTSIPSNRIYDIFEDNQQNLWIGTASGLIKFDREFNRFDCWKDENKKIKAPNKNIIHSIVEDKKKNLWLGTGYGISKFNSDKGTFNYFPINGLSISENYVFIVKFDKKQRLWIGTGSGIYLFDTTNELFIDIKIESLSDLGTWDIRDIIEDRNEDIWIGTRNNGLFKLRETIDNVFEVTNFKHDVRDPHSLPKNVITKILQDNNDRLWIGTENGGLCLYDTLTEKFHIYTHNPTIGSSLKSNSIHDIFEDNQKRLWIGTNNTGINMFDPFHRKFYHERRSPTQVNGLKHNGVTSFLDCGDELWIGSDGGGITIWNSRINTYSYLEHDPKDSNSLGSNSVLCIFRDSEGIIWIGTWAGGLNQYNPDSGKFKRYINNPDDPYSISSNSIYSIAEDKSGNIWVSASGSGICRLNKKTGKFLRIGSEANNRNSLSIQYVYGINIDKSGKIWVTSEEGLNRISMDLDDSYKVEQFHESKENTNSISSKRTRFVFEDSKGRIWIGTNAGLNLYISNEKGFEVFTKSNGLPNNAIRGMTEDKLGGYWITTMKGVSKMIEQEDGKFTFRNYNVSDGLQGDEFVMGASYINEKGKVFLGGTNGFNYFNPSALKDNPYEPMVILTSFKLFNKDVEIGKGNSPLTKSIFSTHEVELRHDQSVFSLDFTALNLTHAVKNQYAYMLEGFETDWNYVGNKRSATYTNLDAGEYLFRVKACNNDGLWNTEDTTLKIIVLPPWWETLWARTSLLLIIIAVAISYYRYKTYKLFKNQVLLENLVEKRTIEVQNQVQEIDIQNKALQQQAEEINAQNEELQQQAEELEVQRDNLNVANKAITLRNQMITDSINYGKRIQNAILPSKMELQEALGYHFVIYRPKDIVSGDFYWMFQTKEYTFIAVVDCTGHGVPGAFMSMMGSTLLNRIVGEMNVYDPAEILKTLDFYIVESLRQYESENQDGMDMIICRMKRDDISTEIAYAGAMNGLLYYDAQNDSMFKLKGNRFSIGGIPLTGVAKGEKIGESQLKGIQYSSMKNFDTQIFHLSEGMMYLTTDGLIDQNDSNRRRLGSKRLKDILLSCVKLPVWRQKLIIENKLASFQQDEAQRDDIALIGIKV